VYPLHFVINLQFFLISSQGN